MEKKPTELKLLKPGSFVLVDDVACRVDSIQLSRPGKHGSAKARLIATGLFTGQKKTIVKPADTKVDVPIIEKSSAQVLAITGDRVQLMDLETYATFEVQMPAEFKGKITEGAEVLVWKFGTNVMIKGLK